MNKEKRPSNEHLFRVAEIYKDLFESRGIPNAHEQEYEFIAKHRYGVRRLARILEKKGEVIGTFPDIVSASLGMEEDMQANAHCKNFSYEIHSRRKEGDNLPKELVVFARRK